MARLDGDESRLRQLNNTTTRAVVEVGWDFSEPTCDARFVRLLDSLAGFPEVLSKNRRDRGFLVRAAPVTSRPIHIEIEKIALAVEDEFLTPAVVDSVVKLTASGLPVDWESLRLGLCRVTCDESQLRTLLGAVSDLSTSLYLSASHKPTETQRQTSPAFVDENGEEYHECIRMILRAISSISNREHYLNIGGFLRVCSQTHNREAIWRGLFEDILSPDSRLKELDLTRFREHLELRYSDGEWIERSLLDLAQCRESKPRIKRLTLELKRPNWIALCLLLGAFEDIEEIDISHAKEYSPLDPGFVNTLLAYPSLRKLSLSGFVVQSMDLFNPCIADPCRGLNKPILEELELKDIVLKDVSSLRHFFSSLDPSTSTSPLATTLRRLHVTQRDDKALNPVDFYDCSTVKALSDMLRSNQALTDVTVTDVDVKDTMLEDQWVQLMTLNGRSLPAPAECRQTALAKACVSAFVSAMYIPNSNVASARSRIDASVIRQIFAFGGPVVPRKIGTVGIYRFDWSAELARLRSVLNAEGDTEDY